MVKKETGEKIKKPLHRGSGRRRKVANQHRDRLERFPTEGRGKPEGRLRIKEKRVSRKNGKRKVPGPPLSGYGAYHWRDTGLHY